MNPIDPELRIDIRHRLRAHGRRELAVARMRAPADWQAALRHDLSRHRDSQPMVGASDLKLFLQSFAIFFTATIMFLI